MATRQVHVMVEGRAGKARRLGGELEGKEGSRKASPGEGFLRRTFVSDGIPAVNIPHSHEENPEHWSHTGRVVSRCRSSHLCPKALLCLSVDPPVGDAACLGCLYYVSH